VAMVGIAIAAYRRTHGTSQWLDLRICGRLALCLHSSHEPSELLQWPSHDDSTINIDIIIITIISIIYLTVYTSVLLWHVFSTCAEETLYILALVLCVFLSAGCFYSAD